MSLDVNEDDLTTEQVNFASKLGRLVIHANKVGITKIEFAGEIRETSGEEVRNDVEPETQPIIKLSDNKHILTCARWLQQYFSDPSKLNDVDQPTLNMRYHQNKPFLVKVWRILRQRTRPGDMITYGKLAAMAGNPNAGRSVGLAMRRNPFPIVVPCHRVIKSNAKIGNYSGLNGTVTKKWLLDHEKNHE